MLEKSPLALVIEPHVLTKMKIYVILRDGNVQTQEIFEGIIEDEN